MMKLSEALREVEANRLPPSDVMLVLIHRGYVEVKSSIQRDFFGRLCWEACYLEITGAGVDFLRDVQTEKEAADATSSN